MNNVSHREYHRLRNIAYGGESVYKDVVRANGDASYDPWEEKAIIKFKELDFLEERRPVAEPATLKHEPVSLAADGRPLKAVRKPAQEKSYNPTSEDWIRRFDREGQREVDAERQRIDAEGKEREKQERIAKAQEEEEQQKQWESEWESEWEGIASGPEDTPEWSTKKRPERKTKTQRNKIKRRKEEEAKKKHEAKEKIKKQQAEQLKLISKQVQENERLRQEKLLSIDLVRADDSSDDSEDVALKRIQPFGKAPYVCSCLTGEMN
jgi:nucleolar protein 53